MAIGLGQILGMGLLSQLMGGFGGKKEERPPQQGLQQGVMDVAKLQALKQQQGQGNNRQQGFGGIGGMMSGVSNQLFPGMSPEQRAQLAIGFNSMRLRPDANLATAMREKIASAQAQKQKQQGIEKAVNYLSSLSSSKEFPNGRTDLITLVKEGLISPAEAIQAAIKVEKPSAFMEKMAWLDANPNASNDQKQLAGITTPQSQFAEKMAWLEANPDASDEEKQLAGISMNLATSIEEYEYYKANFKGEGNPESYVDFLVSQKGGTTVNVGGGDPEGYTPFWKKLDEAYASEYIDWTSGMGADTMGNLVKVEEVLNALKNDKPLTGSVIGLMPDFVNAFINPEVTQAREAVESVVQRNLKAILGAQFTEKEGERLISRAYNPKLSPQMNAARLAILVEQMRQAVVAKNAQAEWVRANGTLMGWEGKLPHWNDFWTAVSANQVGEVVCDNQLGDKQMCYRYTGGDDLLESNWKLVE